MDKEKALKIWLPVIADGVKDLPECKESLEMAVEALENQKTGHWKKYNGIVLWECSECGEIIYSETEQDRKENHKYCNRCGAKMEGE